MQCACRRSRQDDRLHWTRCIRHERVNLLGTADAFRTAAGPLSRLDADHGGRIVRRLRQDGPTAAGQSGRPGSALFGRRVAGQCKRGGRLPLGRPGSRHAARRRKHLSRSCSLQCRRFGDRDDAGPPSDALRRPCPGVAGGRARDAPVRPNAQRYSTTAVSSVIRPSNVPRRAISICHHASEPLKPVLTVGSTTHCS